MSDVKVVKSNKILLYTLFILPLVASILMLNVPIEDFLSEYSFRNTFPWYIPWRGAVTSLIIWIIAGLVYSGGSEAFEYLLWGSYFSFAVFHYMTIYIVNVNGYRTSLYPLVYAIEYSSRTVEGLTYYLDLGQVLLLANLAFSVKARKYILGMIRQKRLLF